MPRVSVIIPAYNSGRTIKPTLESVFAQTFSDYEVIVIDDGSTDDTRAQAEAFGARVRYAYQRNRERSAARNHGIRLAQGKYIAFLDADDQWRPEKLAKQVALLDRNSDLALVYCWANLIDPSGAQRGLIGQDFPIEQAENCAAFEGLLLGRSIPTLCTVIRAACLVTTGVFDEQICYIEDWDLWLRFALHYPIGFVPAALADYQMHGTFLPKSMLRCRVPETRPLVAHKALDLARQARRPLTAQMERQAVAHAWWRSSLILYAVPQIDDAQASLSKALASDREAFSTGRFNWRNDLIDFAIFLYDTGTPPAEAEAFVTRFFNHLPEAARDLRKARRAVLGQLKAGYAFQAQACGDMQQSSRLMRGALAYYPPLARNLGTVSIGLRGTWLDRAVRKLKRRSSILA
jgi:glycosyltransferase involved in cell wall biosynthesis